jgi:tetratricopeptide (TPR) repeat protein
MDRKKFELGLRALEEAEFNEAIEIFSEIAVNDQGRYEVWINLGVCYLETARPDLAIEAFERAVKSDSNQAEAFYLLGTAMGASGNIDKAAECYRRALEIEPHHQKAEEFLSRTSVLIESREYYRRALSLLSRENKPSNWINHAIGELLQSVAIFHNSPARHNLEQIADEITNMKKESTLQIDTIPEKDRLWAKNCETGFKYLKMRLWESAISYYNQALSFRNYDAFVHHLLGIAFFKVGATEDAVKAWLMVMELDPDYDFTTLVNLPKFDRNK